MEWKTLIASLDAEIAKLTQARNALVALSGNSSTPAVASNKKRRFSAATRRKMALAQQARWAKRKAQ